LSVTPDQSVNSHFSNELTDWLGLNGQIGHQLFFSGKGKKSTVNSKRCDELRCVIIHQDAASSNNRRNSHLVTNSLIGWWVWVWCFDWSNWPTAIFSGKCTPSPAGGVMWKRGRHHMVLVEQVLPAWWVVLLIVFYPLIFEFIWVPYFPIYLTNNGDM
jgi:hypothetical protein